MDITRIFKVMYRRNQIRRGLKIGKNVYLSDSAMIDHEYCWLVTIGDDSIISSNAVILCHDSSPSTHTGIHKIGKVTIGCRTYIGAETVILPGVSIGNDVIVGAGSVVTKNIPDNSVAAGNPARVIESISTFVEKYESRQQQAEVVRLKWQKLRSAEGRNKIEEALAKNDICYLSLSY